MSLLDFFLIPSCKHGNEDVDVVWFLSQCNGTAGPMVVKGLSVDHKVPIFSLLPQSMILHFVKQFLLCKVLNCSLSKPLGIFYDKVSSS